MGDKQRFRVTITFEYEADMGRAQESYGTVDPLEMAAVDAEYASEDIGNFMESTDSDHVVTVEPIP